MCRMNALKMCIFISSRFNPQFFNSRVELLLFRGVHVARTLPHRVRCPSYALRVADHLVATAEARAGPCARQMAKEGRRGLTENGFGLSRDCGALDRSMMLRIAPHRSSQRHPGSGPASEPEGDGV